MAKGSSEYVTNKSAVKLKQVNVTGCVEESVLSEKKVPIQWMSVFVCLSLVILMSFFSLVRADEQTVFFDIPQQSADGALTELANQANISVVFDFDAISEYQASELKGRYQVRKAVALLLADTKLNYRFNYSGHLIITKNLDSNRDSEMRTKKILAAVIGFFVGTGAVQGAVEREDLTLEPEDNSLFELVEIVVTATRREANLQDTALSISAVSGDRLDSLGVVSLGDIIDTIPGATLADTGPGRRGIVLRGVSSSALGFGHATTASFLDDFVLALGASDIKLVDMERVEVLKGPQGTLYGASAMGGLVRYISNKPNVKKISGGFRSYASNIKDGGSNYGGHAYLNLPINESLAVRTVLYNYDNAGFIDNLGTDSRDVNFEETSGGRLALRWYISDAATFDLTYFYEEMLAGGGTSVGSQAIASTFTPTPHNPLNALAPPNNLIAPNLSSPSYFGNTNGSTYTDFEVLNFKLNYEFEKATVSLIGTNKQIGGGFEADVSPYVSVYDGITVFDSKNKSEVDSGTLELRIVSKTKGLVDWMAGFWFDKYDTEFTRVTSAYSPNNVFLFGFFPTATGDILDDQIIFGTSKEKAVYGEVGFNFTDYSRLTLGYRRSDVELDSAILQANGSFDQLVGLPYLIGVDERTQESVDTYKANFEYNFGDDILVYALATSGYRAGGFNRGGLLSNPSTFVSDTLWNYELGFKSSWFDRHLTANFGVYVQNWEDMQLTAFDGESFVSGTVNVGQAQINGVEAELRYGTTSNFNVGVNYTYIDAFFKEDYISGVDQTIVTAKNGDRLPGSAKNSFSLFADWKIPLSQEMTVSINANYRYIGSRLNDLGTDYPPNKSYEIVNLRAGVEHKNGLELTLFADNLLDERATYASNQVGSLTQVFVNRPRVLGLNFGYSF